MHCKLFLVLFVLAATAIQAESVGTPSAEVRALLPPHPAPLLLSSCGKVSEVEIPKVLSLSRAEEILIQNNLTILAARFNVDSLRAQRLIATYHPNPSMTLGTQSWNVAHPERYWASDSTTASDNTYTVHTDWPIEMGEKRRYRTENADALLRQGEAQVLDAIRTQLFQLRQTYFNAVLAQANREVAQADLETFNSTEELLKKQVGKGGAAEADLIKWQANRLQYRTALVTAEETYEQSLRALINQLAAQLDGAGSRAAKPAGKPEKSAAPVAGIELTATLATPPIEVQLDEEREATVRRPDVVAARASVDAADRAVAMAHAQRAIDLTPGTEYVRNGGDNTVGLTLTFQLPFFNNHKGNIDQAEAQLWQAEAQYRQTHLQALTDVDVAFRAYKSSQELLRVYAEENLAKSKQSYEIQKKSYQLGASSLLDMLDAQRTLDQTLLSYNQSRYAYRLSLYQLEEASGKTLDIPAAEGPAAPAPEAKDAK